MAAIAKATAPTISEPRDFAAPHVATPSERQVDVDNQESRGPRSQDADLEGGRLQAQLFFMRVGY